MARILIIDDDEEFLLTLENSLTAAGHAIVTATDGINAARLFRREPFEVIVTDIVMPNREGLETIIALRRDFPEVPVIAISGGTANSRMYLGMARRLGAHRALLKPFSEGQLNDAIQSALAKGAVR